MLSDEMFSSALGALEGVAHLLDIWELKSKPCFTKLQARSTQNGCKIYPNRTQFDSDTLSIIRWAQSSNSRILLARA